MLEQREHRRLAAAIRGLLLAPQRADELELHVLAVAHRAVALEVVVQRLEQQLGQLLRAPLRREPVLGLPLGLTQFPGGGRLLGPRREPRDAADAGRRLRRLPSVHRRRAERRGALSPHVLGRRHHVCGRVVTNPRVLNQESANVEDRVVASGIADRLREGLAKDRMDASFVPGDLGLCIHEAGPFDAAASGRPGAWPCGARSMLRLAPQVPHSGAGGGAVWVVGTRARTSALGSAFGHVFRAKT